MKFSAGNGKTTAAFSLAATLLLALSACESGPSMEQLAPKMPKLKADVPDSRHPESLSGEFPNINNAPDRPSVVRSDDELETIENSLEKDGQTHVKQAVGRITGGAAEEDVADEEGEAPEASTATTMQPPTETTPPE